MIRIAT